MAKTKTSSKRAVVDSLKPFIRKPRSPNVGGEAGDPKAAADLDKAKLNKSAAIRVILRENPSFSVAEVIAAVKARFKDHDPNANEVYQQKRVVFGGNAASSSEGTGSLTGLDAAKKLVDDLSGGDAAKALELLRNVKYAIKKLTDGDMTKAVELMGIVSASGNLNELSAGVERYKKLVDVAGSADQAQKILDALK